MRAELTRARIMGVLNVTPDSLSGDGIYASPTRAIKRGLEMVREGAAIIDVGGESTRPGYTPISPEEEQRRVLPVVMGLAAEGVTVSIDTRKANVAASAIQAGARMVNDVSGTTAYDMLDVVRDAGVDLVLTHNAPVGPDPATDVGRGLEALLARAIAAGVPEEKLLVDPGLGFGKGWRSNLRLLRDLSRIADLGFEVVIGPSRKGTIGKVLGGAPDDRLEGGLALAAIGVARGASVVRMHDVRQAVRAVAMTEALMRA